MLHHTGDADPLHDRPAKLTADEMRDGMQSVHGSLLRLERTALSVDAAGAYHAAAALVDAVLWPVPAA